MAIRTMYPSLFPFPAMEPPLVFAIIPAMRRWLLTCLLVFLPFQFSWAVVASYCQHETTPAQTQHFGHHDHAHTPHPADLPDEHSLPGTDKDCTACLAGSAVALTGVLALEQGVPLPIAPAARMLFPASLFVDLPERPDWSRLA